MLAKGRGRYNDNSDADSETNSDTDESKCPNHVEIMEFSAMDLNQTLYIPKIKKTLNQSF